MSKEKKVYICGSCGNEVTVWSGRCSFCGEWNSLKEVCLAPGVKNYSNSEKIEIEDISKIIIKPNYRIQTKISELDRVLGGGIVPGSIILLGGEPGIGKSTLLMQLCLYLSNILYISGEESQSQIKIRAERIGLKTGVKLASTGDLEAVAREIEMSPPKLLIIDSIQTVFLSSIASTPGSLVQVRECGVFLQKLAKKSNIPIIVVGHVTKEGSLAGPRILEHLVDAVLYLEGERFHDARVLRSVKNRFGATNEVGIFSITERGMIEIKNPSKLFLEEKNDTPGSVVTATMEGTRPILIEVQSLAIPTHFGYAKRTSSGFDLNRLNLMVAVITKNTKCNLGNFDVYLNIVGGIKISEPSVDLAVCMAIISSYKNKAIPNNLCVFGEVGLSGEIRRVIRQKERINEAKKLGYRVFENPKNLNSFLELIKI